MSFNLKKKSKKIAINIVDQTGLDTYLHLLIDQLNESNTLPTEDALARLVDMDALAQYGQISFQDLKEMISNQEDAVEKQQDMQNRMVNIPQQQPGSPVTIMPTKAKGMPKMIKPFNLKRSQFENLNNPVPMNGFNDTLNDVPELGEEQLMDNQDVGIRKFVDGKDVQQWLQNETTIEQALQYVVQNSDTDKADFAKQLVEQFYDMSDDPSTEPRDLEMIAGQIFDSLSENSKQEHGVMAVQKEFNIINETIKKIAQDTVKKNNKKTIFNLQKTAQHKTLNNAILWGPSDSRKVDPFSRQPVSDWHIVERNKGFGLVVDDIWNIDYETIWRENIMDKFSRPYRDTEGNWVGGYLNKRFEMDKNIPDSTNYQLKPGQLRRPVLPEYGNTESRLQAARAKGDIEGGPVVDKTKPFNWKEAYSKKKS